MRDVQYGKPMLTNAACTGGPILKSLPRFQQKQKCRQFSNAEMSNKIFFNFKITTIILTKTPPSLSSIQCFGALIRFKCFFGPRPYGKHSLPEYYTKYDEKEFTLHVAVQHEPLPTSKMLTVDSCIVQKDKIYMSRQTKRYFIRCTIRCLSVRILLDRNVTKSAVN